MLASEYFQNLSKLEQVSGRLVMTELLSLLYLQLDKNEARIATYMLFGNLGPSYLANEFGMGEKMVIRAISRATNKDAVMVSELFKRKGDLGLVIEELKQDQVKYLDKVSDVFNKLEEIAKKMGEGSQEAKVERLANLLTDADKMSARYIVRIVMGKLRLGVGEMTVLDGLSWMICGDKSMHGELENAYNNAADVGLIAEELLARKSEDKEIWKINAVEWLNTMGSRIGVPMVMALCNRMATFDEVVDKLGTVACEPKYDGTRVQIHYDRVNNRVVTFSRNLEESTYMFPELAKIGDWLDADEVILDSEAIGIDQAGGWLDFQTTMTRKRKHNISEKHESVPLKFMAFDVLYASGKGASDLGAEGDIHDWPLVKRKELLDKILLVNELMAVTPVEYKDSAKDLRLRHEQYLNEGLEGVILKQVNSSYVPGRKKKVWIKMKEVENSSGKLPDTVDCLVMGYYRGEGRRGGGGVGSLLLGVRGKQPIGDSITSGLFESENTEERFWTVSKLGSKLTDLQLAEITKVLDEKATSEPDKLYEVPKGLEVDVWVEPFMVVEVAADNITRSPLHSAKLALRFPRLVKIRDDKGPGEVTSLEELNELFKIQKG